MKVPGFSAEASLYRTSGVYQTTYAVLDRTSLAAEGIAVRLYPSSGPSTALLDLTRGPQPPVPSGGCSGGGCHCHGILSCGQLFHLCCDWFTTPQCVHDGSFDGLHCVCKSNGMCGDFGPAAPFGLSAVS
jgi:hypothetical protein